MTRAVVTGASGFLGLAVCRALRERGMDVVPVCRRSFPGTVRVDDYSQTPAGNILVHLAEERDRRRAEEAGEGYERGAGSALRALTAKKWQRIIYASSAALYGSHYEGPVKPGDGIFATDVYTRSKKSGEEAVLTTGVGVVARMTNLYGPGMAPGNVVSTIIAQLGERGSVRVRDATPVRDFLWIEDAAEAVAAMTGPGVGARPSAGVFNVGSGVGISIHALARLILETAGEGNREIVSTHSGSRLSRMVLDISGTTAAWGWRPRVELRQGISALLASYARAR